MTCKDCIHYVRCAEIEMEYIGDIAEIRHCFDNKANYKKIIRGEWKQNNNLGECSRCGDIVMVKSNFCSTCGADMRGDKE